jgi:hypothetical protein
VFLTQDAIPSSGPDWLATLARNFETRGRRGVLPQRAAPRRELLTRVFSENDPGYTAGRRETRLPDAAVRALDPHERRLLYNFNDVASALRRELWERIRSRAPSSARTCCSPARCSRPGYTVVYDDVATVEHSHDYGPSRCASARRSTASSTPSGSTASASRRATTREVLSERSSRATARR